MAPNAVAVQAVLGGDGQVRGRDAQCAVDGGAVRMRADGTTLHVLLTREEMFEEPIECDRAQCGNEHTNK